MAIEQIHTYCAMCVSRCGVMATVEDGRFAKVSVDPDHPNGCICIKGTAAPEIVNSPDRLGHPMLRTRPKSDPEPGWKAISWDEAMAIAASRFADIRDRDGPEAVVFGRATPAGSSTVDIEPWVQRLANGFGSPNILTTTHICTWNRTFGAKNTFGVLTPTPDIENTNCILLWGTNPQACVPALAVNISHARRRGAKLIVIDPRLSEAGALPENHAIAKMPITAAPRKSAICLMTRSQSACCFTLQVMVTYRSLRYRANVGLRRFGIACIVMR